MPKTTDRYADKQADRQGQTARKTNTWRGAVRGGNCRETDRQTYRDRNRQRETETNRDRQIQTERELHIEEKTQ